MSDRWSRLAPLTGVIFAGLAVAGVVVGKSPPDSNASGAKVIAFYEAHRSALRVSDILFAVACLFLVLFAGSLRGYLRRTPAVEALSALVLAGAVLLAVGLTVISGLDYALADVPSHLDPAAAQALNVLTNNVGFTINVGGCVLGVASGLAILRGARLPNWLGWVAILIGIATATPATFIAFGVFIIWSVVVSVLLYIRTARPETAATTGTPLPE